MTDFQIPDGIEPVIGWRYWWLDDDGILQSLHWHMPWVPRERATAACKGNGLWRGALSGRKRPPAHTPPSKDCRCGIYASASLDDLRTATYALRSGLVVGELYLWGDIVQGETGYRAQFAYPKTLYVVPEGQADGADIDKVRVALSERYGVPVGTMAASDCDTSGTLIGSLGQVTAQFSVTITQFGAAITKAAQAAAAFGESMEKLNELCSDPMEELKKLTGDGAKVQTPPLPARRNWTLLNKTPKRALYQTRDKSAWGPGQP